MFLLSNNIDLFESLFNMENAAEQKFYAVAKSIKWFFNIVVDILNPHITINKNIATLIFFCCLAFSIGVIIRFIKYFFGLLISSCEEKTSDFEYDEPVKAQNSFWYNFKYKNYILLKDMIENDIKTGKDLDINKYETFVKKHKLKTETINKFGIGYVK